MRPSERKKDIERLDAEVRRLTAEVENRLVPLRKELHQLQVLCPHVDDDYASALTFSTYDATRLEHLERTIGRVQFGSAADVHVPLFGTCGICQFPVSLSNEEALCIQRARRK